MKRNMDYDKLEQNLKQLRFPDRVPALSFNPQEPPRAILIRNNLLALAAGIACLALVVGLALWSHHWKSEIQAPPVSETPSVTEPSGEAEPPFESDPTESTEENSEAEESAAESTPSQEDPVVVIASDVPVSAEFPPPPVSITPLSVARWKDNGENEKASFGRVLRTEEELRSFLTPLCSREQDLYHEPGFFPLDAETNQYSYSTKMNLDSVVVENQSLFDQGQVLLGVYTYYPLPAIETIDLIQAQGNTITVYIRAVDSPTHSKYTHRTTTLIAIPDYAAWNIDQVEVVTDYKSEFPLVPDPRPEPTQSYDLFKVSNRNFQGGSALPTELITSFENFEKWIDNTFIPYREDLTRLKFSQSTGPDTPSISLDRAALLAKYQPWFEQGGALAVMAYHNSNYGFPFNFYETVREETRLILHFHEYDSSGSGFSVELPAASDWLFILPMEGDAAQGITQTEFDLTTYYKPWS